MTKLLKLWVTCRLWSRVDLQHGWISRVAFVWSVTVSAVLLYYYSADFSICSYLSKRSRIIFEHGISFSCGKSYKPFINIYLKCIYKTICPCILPFSHGSNITQGPHVICNHFGGHLWFLIWGESAMSLICKGKIPLQIIFYVMWKKTNFPKGINKEQLNLNSESSSAAWRHSWNAEQNLERFGKIDDIHCTFDKELFIFLQQAQ